MEVLVRASVVALSLVTGVASGQAQQGVAPPPPQAAPPPQAIPPPAPPLSGANAQTQARHNIAVLEAVFETAVQLGAQMLREQVKGAMPDMMVLTGAPRARGVRLEGYGVYFSVDVPGVSPTVAWTVQVLNQNDVNATNALQQLRAMLRDMTDRRQRDELDRFLRLVARQFGVPEAPAGRDPGGMPPPGVVTAHELTPQAAPEMYARPSAIADPFAAYENAVKQALIDAMLDHSGPLDIGPDEWLTVGARDNEDRRLSFNNVYDLATIVLRIKGSDLAAFRAGRLTRDEARARVEIREF